MSSLQMKDVQPILYVVFIKPIEKVDNKKNREE